MQTAEAEIKLQAHPQRTPGAESGVKSGAVNGPLRAGGKAKAEYLLTLAGVNGRPMCWHRGEVAANGGNQGGTAGIFIPVLVSMGNEGSFFIPEGEEFS